jgi:hypothetical protein
MQDNLTVCNQYSIFSLQQVVQLDAKFLQICQHSYLDSDDAMKMPSIHAIIHALASMPLAPHHMAIHLLGMVAAAFECHVVNFDLTGIALH